MDLKQEGNVSKKKPKRTPRVNKEDISHPRNVNHFYHLGPTDTHPVQGDVVMQLPTPCPGSVDDEANSQSMTPGCPEGYILVKQTYILTIKQDVQKLKSFATELLARIDHICHSSSKQSTSNANVSGAVKPVVAASLNDQVEDEKRSSADTSYVNTPENAEPISNIARPPNPDDKARDRGSSNVNRMGLVCDFTDEDGDITLKDKHMLDEGASSETECPPICIANPTYDGINGIVDDGRQATRKQINFNKTDFITNALQANLHAKADERECLAAALRAHTVELVDNVIFNESELPDLLTADSCVTEDECEVIRQLPNRKDQIRVLLSAIRGRDFKVLVKFLEKIGRSNPEIADKINRTHGECLAKKVRPPLCALCMLVERVNIKHVSDNLLEIYAIGEGLNNEIIFDKKPTGAQSELWSRVIGSLNELPQQIRERVFIVLFDTLNKKHYTYVQDGITRSLKKNKLLLCQCRLQAGPRVSDPTLDCSPRSSTDASRDSGELLSNTERKEVVSHSGRGSLKSPERERRFNRNIGSIDSISEEEILETKLDNTETENESTATTTESQETETFKESTYV